MKDILDLQKRNFIENGHPSLEQRLDRLKRCVALIETHDDQIIESLNADYKMRSKYEIITSEISQTLRTLNFSIKNTGLNLMQNFYAGTRFPSLIMFIKFHCTISFLKDF